jgi:O-antigen/teichoic acid export membrane protein
MAVHTEPDDEAALDSRRRGIRSLRLHTAKGVMINGAFDVGLLGVSALRGLIVAGFLTRAQYGVWGVLGLTMFTALALKNQFGAGDKYVQQSETDQELAFRTAFTVEAIFAAATIPVAAVITLIYAFVSGHWVIVAPGLLMLLMIPAIVLEFPITVFYRSMDYRRQRRLLSADPLVGAVATIALAIAGAGYWSFVIGLLAGTWTGAFVAIRACPYRLAFHYERGMLRDYLRFSTPMLIAGLSGIVMFQVLYLVGADALGLIGLGTFTLVGNFVQFTDQADATVTQTLYPAICAVQEKTELLAEIFVKSNRLSLMWAVHFGVGLTLFASDLCHFAIGARWLPAVPLFEIMGLVTAFNHVGYNWSAFVRARGDTRPIAWLSVIFVAAFLAAAVPLMYTVGVTGIGWAFASTAVISLVMRAVLLNRMFRGFWLTTQLFRAFQPTAVAAVPILALRLVFGGEHGLLEAIGVFLLYALLTIAATLLLERNLLREALGYIVARSTPRSASASA